MEEKYYYVYILTNQRNGILYTGVTGNLLGRVWQHKENMVKGFTKQYQVHHLVYYEVHYEIHAAITREKQIKKWRRSWKLNLIERFNPGWNDLYEDLTHG